MKTVRYVVVKVVIDHDDDCNPSEVLGRATLVADEEVGFVESSEVVDVLTVEEAES